MDKNIKETLKDLVGVIVTGGLYFIIIFIKVLFTTPAGQKLVEEELNKRIKAKRIVNEEEDEDEIEEDDD